MNGLDVAWQFFSEGTAVLASSVGQPRGQFSHTVWLQNYMFYAKNFVLFGSGRSRDLHKSYRAPTSDAVFSVLLWPLTDLGEGVKPRRISAEAGAAQILQRVNPDGSLTFVIPAIHWATYDRLGLIITRLDAQEALDPIGAYTVGLHPGAD